MPTLRRCRTASVVSLLAAFAASASGACGGGAPTMKGRAGLLSATAVAQKCAEAAHGHERPFVVEWDATDLSSFEAKAARDTVFVRYQGCEIDVLYGCSDPVAAGRFGAYGTPQFTSGTTQGFDVKNEGELYAKLPLGAASLSGKVQAGEELHLKYFIAGVAMDTRDAIYAGDLASVAECASATHYVWAYNLGAFELSSTETSSVEASAGIGNIGAGGSSGHQETALGNGGDMTSCATQDQRSCRVPIRLALRPILPGQNPAGAPSTPPGSGTASAGNANGGGAPADQAKALWQDAGLKHDAGDGKGCLDEMNRALSFDMRLTDSEDFKELHARCEMAAGQCDQGKTDFRATIAAADTKRELQDWQLDKQTREVSNEECSSATATNEADYIQRAVRELKAAAAIAPTPDGTKCHALIDGITARLKTIKHGDASFNDKAASLGMAQYERAGACVAAASGKCSDGLAVEQSQCALVPMAGCPAAAANAWGMVVKSAAAPACK